MTNIVILANTDQAWGYLYDNPQLHGTLDFYNRYAPVIPDPFWEIHANGGNDWLWFGDSGGGAMAGTTLTLFGGVGNDTLCGSYQDDTIDGGTGNDVMFDSYGSDTYYVDSFGDVITENYFSTDGKGTDTVVVSIDYALPANMESLVLSGASDLNGWGNIYSNVLTGNSGANILDGLQGIDTLIGGRGDDIYVIDSTFDVVVELAGQGTDIIESGVSYTLSDFVEQGFLNSAGRNQSLTGNALGNLLVGNGGRNTLSGLAGKDELRGEGGADTLLGGAGIDTLDGGAGADRMDGGLGNDIYYVDNGLDLVIEATADATGGYDTVFTSVAIAMPDNVERLVFNGLSDGIMLSGNDLANYLIGNYTDDIIDLGAGNDTSLGGAGDDDVSGGAGNDNLQGEFGADSLAGGAGRDILAGGAGADVFIFIAVTDSAGSVTDLIRDFQDDLDRIDLRGIDAAAAPGDQALAFIGGEAFSAAGQVRAFYVAANNTTHVDVSIDDDADAEMTLILSGQHLLTAAQFLL